jgi:hypothetical protein
MNPVRRVFLPAAIVLGMSVLASARSAHAQANTFDFTGCRISMPTLENSDIARSILGGTYVYSTFTGSYMPLYCPLDRRNTSTYGDFFSTTNRDRVRMSSLRVRVYDGSSSHTLRCYGYVGTATGSTYYSATKYACSTADGCTAAPSNSYVGARELYWSNPFGTSDITNQGATVGAYCAVPKGSSIYSLRGVFASN